MYLPIAEQLPIGLQSARASAWCFSTDCAPSGQQELKLCGWKTPANYWKFRFFNANTPNLINIMQNGSFQINFHRRLINRWFSA